MPKPDLTYAVLREIAESASGMRDKDLWFVVTGTPAKFTWSTTPVAAGDDTEVIHVASTDDPVSSVSFAQIGAQEGNPVNLMKVTVPPIGSHPGGTFAADAVFWSVSAVEKFLVPYYASVYGDRGPDVAAVVRDVLLRGMNSAGPGVPAHASVAEAPFALAHLPSSEYVGEPDGATFVARLAVLHGGGHAKPVFLAPRAQGREASAAVSGSRRRYSRSAGR